MSALESVMRVHAAALGLALGEPTSERAGAAWARMLAGYSMSAERILGDSLPIKDRTHTTQVERDVWTTCADTLVQLHGEVCISYTGRGRRPSSFSISQLVDCYSLRLQTPERLAREIGEALLEYVPVWQVHISVVLSGPLGRGFSLHEYKGGSTPPATG